MNLAEITLQICSDNQARFKPKFSVSTLFCVINLSLKNNCVGANPYSTSVVICLIALMINIAKSSASVSVQPYYNQSNRLFIK